MRELTYYIALTLDGFIAGPDDQVDFYPVSEDHTQHMNATYPEVLPTHIRQAIGADDAPNRLFDTVVMGRRTYDPALELGITDPYAHLRTVVFSRTLTESPDPKVEVTAADPVARVRELKAEESPYGIYLAGGGALAGALLDEIDRLVVKKYPVVAGAGISAFTTDFRPTQLALEEVSTFDNGCAVLTYARA
ncbi:MULTISPECIES: dihydrofolate reductase family protein [Mumia]|uniref:dihydrofolate reductase family protein n=1 Tax=Mumia TaxID=1546255 RepID=UPI001422383B|nr:MULTISPECIES: dihydrofolate reductase family protein [unclassified Mumia]QMW66359.1 dihydrofolate reductase family protein [Mumia sp. ZJ1417]